MYAIVFYILSAFALVMGGFFLGVDILMEESLVPVLVFLPVALIFNAASILFVSKKTDEYDTKKFMKKFNLGRKKP